MGIINVLDKHTANLIAAGEVVERPSSAIKELLENSADARATNISVEIKNGGSTYIRVSDNGCGIAKEDVPTCILRHATSKIRVKEDLEAISTLGFRGEALAAIAAVTRLRIMTKRREDATGTFFSADFGEDKFIEETGCPDGTTIIAENLFENVPARRKFMRKDITEAKAVVAACEKFALSKPHIALTLISDGTVRLKTPGDGSLKSCIYACLGREFCDSMLEVDFSLSGIEVTGFIGRPEISRPNRNLQNFFINGRYIKSGTLSAGLEEGFKSFCPIGKFPACVLFVNLDVHLVDVNIHPAKLEVKFTNERPVFEAVMYGVRNALSRKRHDVSFPEPEIIIAPKPSKDFTAFMQKPEGIVINDAKDESRVLSELSQNESEIIRDKGIISVPEPNIIEQLFDEVKNRAPNEKNFDYSIPDYAKKQKEAEEEMPSSPAYAANELSLFESIPSKNTEQRAPYQDSADDELSAELQARAVSGVTVIGEAFNSYILAEHSGKLYIIDKHAAHERIIYESLKKAKHDGGSQLLLMPVSVNLSHEEASAITENGKYLEDVGFTFEEFGTNTYLLRGIPSEMDAETAAETFVFLTGKIAACGGRSVGDIFDRALYTAACKAAVKAGTVTSKLSNTLIADRLFSDEAVLYCPHGRPVIIEFPKGKLDKMFSRT